MDWFVLGIEPTKDKAAITNAYRQKLRQTNPDDKPEEFKALRQAYEEALALADREDTPSARDESPVGLWMESVARLYGDYASRIDPARWQELMRSDVCIGLDTRPAAEEALLKFLMEQYFLPQAVWKVLDETFAFSQRVEELYEAWPREFIDHAVISGIRFSPALDYQLFIPGRSAADCDAYRRLYSQANQMPLAELDSVLAQMDALSEKHPYGEALRFRFYMETGRQAEGKDGFRRLADDYPNDPLLATVWANICLDEGDAEKAQQIASHILEIAPKHFQAKWISAKCLAAKKQYHEAKDIAYELIHSSSENPVLADQITETMRAWNEQLILDREARYAQAPEDADNALELAWCYAQNERVEDALALAQKIDPNCEDAFAYHNLIGKLYHNTKKYDLALEHLLQVEQIIRALEDDGTDQTRKRKARLPEMLQVQAHCLVQLGRTEEAKAKLEEALAEAPEDTEVLSLMGKILYESGDYPYAVNILQRLLQVSPGAWVAEMFTALCLYHMHQDRDAYDAVNRAISIEPSDLSLYVIKMQILIRNNAFEEVREILSFLEEMGAPEHISTDFIRAELIDWERSDAEAALDAYRSIRNRVEKGETLMWSAELYYRIAVLTGNRLDLSQESGRKTVLGIIGEGLSCDSRHEDLLRYKAWVLKQGGSQEAAIEMYRSMLASDPESPIALEGMAELYYEDLHRNAHKALACYEKLLQTRKTAALYFYAATCKRYLGDLEGARLYYLKELEMDPDDVDGYRGLALIADARGDYDRSLELLEQALAIMAEYGRRHDWLIEHKAQVLRRMGRYEDALAFAAEAADRFGYEGAMQLQFDICCQFGLWSRAQQVLERWKRANRDDPELMAASGRLYLLQGKMFKATLAMAPAKHKLPYDRVQDFRLQLNDLECSHEKQRLIWSSRVKNDPNDDHAMLNLAHVYWHLGMTDAAKGAAQKALRLLDDKLAQNRTDKALYRTRRCLALAILGRAEEAKAELACARQLPLCHFCEYASCKDADIYEAHIEEILGNADDAKKLYAAGRSNWPDELDFAAGEARLKKKGRK